MEYFIVGFLPRYIRLFILVYTCGCLEYFIIGFLPRYKCLFILVYTCGFCGFPFQLSDFIESKLFLDFLLGRKSPWDFSWLWVSCGIWRSNEVWWQGDTWRSSCAGEMCGWLLDRIFPVSLLFLLFNSWLVVPFQL